MTITERTEYTVNVTRKKREYRRSHREGPKPKWFLNTQSVYGYQRLTDEMSDVLEAEYQEVNK